MRCPVASVASATASPSASLAGAVGLDIDVAIVLGAAEGTLPPRPTSDPLLSDADRAAAGLAHVRRRTPCGCIAPCWRSTTRPTITFTVPRGDLRSTAHLERSRWLDHFAGRTDDVTVASHTAGLAATEFPATDAEHRLRSRYTHVRAGGDLGGAADVVGRPGAPAGAHADRRPGERRAHRVRRRPVVGRRCHASTASSRRPSSRRGSPARTPTSCTTSCASTPIDEPADQISITASDIGTTQHRALDRFHRAVIAGELPQPTERRLDRRAPRGADGDVRRRVPPRRAAGPHRAHRLLVRRTRTDAGRPARAGSNTTASCRSNAASPCSPPSSGSAPIPDGSRSSLAARRRAHDRTCAAPSTASTARPTARSSSPTTSPAARQALQRPRRRRTPRSAPRCSSSRPTPRPPRSIGRRPDVEVRTEYGLMGKGDYERFGYTITPEVAELVAAQSGTRRRRHRVGLLPEPCPQRPGWRLYTACLYCEPDELGTAERWAEWLRKRHDPRLARWFGDPPNRRRRWPDDTADSDG